MVRNLWLFCGCFRMIGRCWEGRCEGEEGKVGDIEDVSGIFGGTLWFLTCSRGSFCTTCTMTVLICTVIGFLIPIALHVCQKTLDYPECWGLLPWIVCARNHEVSLPFNRICSMSFAVHQNECSKWCDTDFTDVFRRYKLVLYVAIVSLQKYSTITLVYLSIGVVGKITTGIWIVVPHGMLWNALWKTKFCTI